MPRRRAPQVKNALAELILAKKEADQLTLNDIAAAVGVSQPTVSRWTSGTIPDLDNVPALARWLGVSEADVIARAHEGHLRETRDAAPLVDSLARNVIAALEREGYDLSPGTETRRRVLDALATTLHDALDELGEQASYMEYRSVLSAELARSGRALAADDDRLDEGSPPAARAARPRPEPNE